jgi:hypothetical protein
MLFAWLLSFANLFFSLSLHGNVQKLSKGFVVALALALAFALALASASMWAKAFGVVVANYCVNNSRHVESR